ncbi:MAG: fibronectin type III domain-containing protein [bacterium]|nr:fibronectin type III domain-containing protein [bacterium]
MCRRCRTTESIVLYSWDGVSDLVQDLDYVTSGHQHQHSRRQDRPHGRRLDLPARHCGRFADRGGAAGPTFGHAFRRTAPTRAPRCPPAATDLTGHDETSENLNVTWVDVIGLTPPPAPSSPFRRRPCSRPPRMRRLFLGRAGRPLSVRVVSNSPLTEVVFHYSVDGGAYADSTGVSLGNGIYETVVPGQAGNAVVSWYCTATNSAGRSVSTPVAAPRYTKGWTVATAPPVAALRKTPYLIWPGDPTTMQVLWQTLSTWPCTFEWGLDTNYTLGSVPTAEYGTDHQHTYVMTGLTPGEKYYFRVILTRPCIPARSARRRRRNHEAEVHRLW